jgi:hypothetical protein
VRPGAPGFEEEAAVREDELALTTDELRLLARLGGLVLPPMVGGPEPADDDVDPDGTSTTLHGLACAAAVGRCLLARGLTRMETGADGIEAMVLSGRARRLLAALTAPRMLVEVEVEAGERLSRHAAAVSGGSVPGGLVPGGLVSGGSGSGGSGSGGSGSGGETYEGETYEGEVPGALGLSEREPDVWRVTGVPAADWVLGLVLPRFAGCAPPSGVELRLPVADHLRVDMLLVEGFDEEVEPALLAAGTEPEAAAVWAAALAHRSSSGAVHVARRTPDGWFEAATVRWVAAGTRGLWRLDEEPPQDADGTAVTVVRGATAEELAAEVAAAVAPDAGAEHQRVAAPESEAASCPHP